MHCHRYGVARYDICTAVHTWAVLRATRREVRAVIFSAGASEQVLPFIISVVTPFSICMFSSTTDHAATVFLNWSIEAEALAYASCMLRVASMTAITE